MGDLRKWLSHDDQKDLFEVLVALTLNILFLALIALLFWPLGRTMLAFTLAKGYGVLWIATYVTVVLVNMIQRFFRVNIYDHPDAYVISNLVVSCLLQAGWAAFAANTINRFVAGAPLWIVVMLYLVGVFSCLIAFFAVSSSYQGHIYKLISLPLGLVVFILFSFWLGGGRLLFGFSF